MRCWQLYRLLPWLTVMMQKVGVQLYRHISWKCHCQKGKWICEMTEELIEKMSHVRGVWFKKGSSIKIALWNLCTLCQWSTCSAVNVSLSSSPHTDFRFPFFCFFCLSFHPLSLLSISSLWTVYFSLKALPIPFFGYIVTCPSYVWCFTRRPVSSDVVCSEGTHTCISWQGWLCNHPAPWLWK